MGGDTLECISGPLDGDRWAVGAHDLLLVATQDGKHVAALVAHFSAANIPMQRAAIGYYMSLLNGERVDYLHWYAFDRTPSL